MKELDCSLANWAWVGDRDNKKLAIWHKIFKRSPYPKLEFCRTELNLDGYDLMLHDDWLDIPCIVILRPFAPSLEWLVTKIPEGIFLQLYFYAHFIRAKCESSCYLSIVLALEHKLVLRKPRIVFLIGEVVSPPTPIFGYLSQDSHNEICNIYDKHTYLQPPF
jgi:hypothetical protein